MATMQSQQYIKLAQSLPPRLSRFFARYPPAAFLPQSTITSTPTSTSTPESSLPTSTTSITEQEPSSSSTADVPINPFRSQKHPITGKWHDPVFSLRRQADLVKLAREHGVEELLPPTVKGTAERIRRRTENGLRVKGTGVGQRVKGKESERTLKGRLEKRRQAMLEMPQMVQTWKERGHGRGWKKWPK
ncbi:54S ribosomal protein L25 [Lachnellula suecica]|uniref:54S ribosomal protein L25 n=1 Tax=Lachnellula suecica TaxID=602035 RepID=A0A8T9CCE4_9HELO|nr:54S ribosomal protein L25 [Lachnellula suecica]